MYRYAYVLSWCNSTGGTDQNIEITVKSESTFQTKISFYIFTMMSIADVGWLGSCLMRNFDNLKKYIVTVDISRLECFLVQSQFTAAHQSTNKIAAIVYFSFFVDG